MRRYPRAAFFPQLGRVFAARRQATFTATGGSLTWRIGTLLVSVIAIAADPTNFERLTEATGGTHEWIVPAGTGH